MRHLILIIGIVLIAGSSVAVAQSYPHVTIRDVQEVPDSLLLLDLTDSPLLGDTVWVTGIVATAPRMTNGNALWYTGDRWRFVMTDPADTAFNFITVVASDTLFFRDYVGLDQLAVGDSVELLGRITEYRTLTQLEVMRSDTVMNLLGVSAATIDARTLPVTAFFDGATVKRKPGEYYESGFVRIENVTVIDNIGFEFRVADASGNLITVDDQSNAIFGTTPPPPGALLGHVQGFIFTNSSLDWTINPRDISDYDVAGFATTITDMGRIDSLPGPTTDVRVRAEMVHATGTVTEARVYYSVNGVPHGSIVMSSLPDSVYEATIPQTGLDSAFVSYYFAATDNNAVTVYNPPDTTSDRHFYLALNRLPGIRDVQFNPYGGWSSFRNLTLTLSGIATSDRRDFGAIYLQDGTGPWSGIRILSPADTVVRRGDHLTVTGIVLDTSGVFPFDQTVVDNCSITVNSSGNSVPAPTDVAASDVKTGGSMAEAFESVLIQLNDVFVVNMNEDAVSNSNFGEFGIHEDSTRISGLRVDDYSLNLPYTNDTLRAGQGGKIQLHRGDFFQSMRGILYYSFNEFKLTPRDSADFTGYQTVVTAVEEIAAGVPGSYSLAQNYPNPFNPTTTIEYAIPVTGKVTLKIYNILGQTVTTVVDEVQSAGTYRIRVNESLMRGLATGVYIYQLRAGDYVTAKKMILLR